MHIIAAAMVAMLVLVVAHTDAEVRSGWKSKFAKKDVRMCAKDDVLFRIPNVNPSIAPTVNVYLQDCTKLYLDSSNIHGTVVAALSEALKRNTELSDVYLFNNSIVSDGAAAIGDALKVNDHLTDLHL